MGGIHGQWRSTDSQLHVEFCSVADGHSIGKPKWIYRFNLHRWPFRSWHELRDSHGQLQSQQSRRLYLYEPRYYTFPRYLILCRGAQRHAFSPRCL